METVKKRKHMKKQWKILIICACLWHSFVCTAEKKPLSIQCPDEGKIITNNKARDTIYYGALGGAIGLNTLAGYCIAIDSKRSKQSPITIVRGYVAAEKWNSNVKCTPSYHMASVGQAYKFILKNSITLGVLGGGTGGLVATLAVGTDAWIKWIVNQNNKDD